MNPLDLISSLERKHAIGWHDWSCRYSSWAYAAVAWRHRRQLGWAPCMLLLAVGSYLHHTDAASEEYALLDNIAMVWSVVLMACDLFGQTGGLNVMLLSALATPVLYEGYFPWLVLALVVGASVDPANLRFILFFAAALVCWASNATGLAGPLAHSAWHLVTAWMYNVWIEHHRGGKKKFSDDNSKTRDAAVLRRLDSKHGRDVSGP